MNKLQKNKSTILLLIIALALIGAGSVFAYKKYVTDKPTSQSDGINYSSPTDEEKEAGDKRKEEIDDEEAQRQPDEEPTSPNLKKVSVIITDANQYDDVIEVRAFIPDHYQNGTCLITFTKGTLKVTRSAPAYKDISTTICTNPKITRSEFSTGGEWQVNVAYKSSDAQGISESRAVTIK
jgi:GH25 family lysozyme M1 (1,4-beta-N-acetylmuramidase)